jgi:hypothetical protein
VACWEPSRGRPDGQEFLQCLLRSDYQMVLKRDYRDESIMIKKVGKNDVYLRAFLYFYRNG